MVRPFGNMIRTMLSGVKFYCPWCYSSKIASTKEYKAKGIDGRPIYVFQYGNPTTIEDEHGNVLVDMTSVNITVSESDTVPIPVGEIIPMPCPNCKAEYYMYSSKPGEVLTARYPAEFHNILVNERLRMNSTDVSI